MNDIKRFTIRNDLDSIVRDGEPDENGYWTPAGPAEGIKAERDAREDRIKQYIVQHNRDGEEIKRLVAMCADLRRNPPEHIKAEEPGLPAWSVIVKCAQCGVSRERLQREGCLSRQSCGRVPAAPTTT